MIFDVKKERLSFFFATLTVVILNYLGGPKKIQIEKLLSE
jgi:hypothetical protein